MAASRRYSRRTIRRRVRPRRVIRRRTLRFRRSYRRTRMSRRRILNIASEKKQDNRITFSNVDTPAAVLTAKRVLMQGGSTYLIPYIPTAQDRVIASGPTPDIPGYRTRQNVFMRGYKERVNIVSSTPAQWSLRRICFRLKGNIITNTTTALNPLWHEVSPQGFTRSATQAFGTPLGDAIQDQIFKGAPFIDWNNPFNANLDTDRVSVAYDKIFHFTSGNQSPYTKNIKFWHPMNKNFTYRDDEQGEGLVTSVLHTSGLKGMGDYYIVDLWTCTTSTTDNELSVSYEGTLYWHER